MAESALLLDELLPEWDQRDVHERDVSAPPRRAVDLALAIETSDLKASAAMMAVRFAPTAIAERRSPRLPQRRLVEVLEEIGLVELGRREDEVVFGAAGRFWRVREGNDAIADAEDFRDYDEPGSAKLAINLRAVDAEGGCTLSTETRVLATDPGARRRMRLYWALIRGPGDLIRREVLAATARAALE